MLYCRCPRVPNAMHSLGRRIYRTGEIEVDLSQRTVRNGGEAHSPRPRTFDLLWYLIEHRDRVVPREELLEQLWAGTSVTSNSLTQCVNEARKVLGDDPKESRFIRTVAKSGYQFIGPIDELAGYVEEITTLEMEYEEQPALPAPRRVHWKLPAIVAALAVLAAAVLWRFSAQVPTAETVIVLPFENSSNTDDLDWLREGLPDMLITNLGRAGGMRLLGREQVRALLAPEGSDQKPARVFDRALSWARQHRADTVITGSFARFGEKLRVAVHVYRSSDGSLQSSESFTADQPEQILTHMDLASLKLATELGHPIQQEDRLAGLSSLMTPNLQAYRYYTLGMAKADALASTEAIGLFQQATALDPNFAMAHARIGYTYTSSLGRPREAIPSLEAAFRLSAKLTPSDRLHIAAWYALANFDYAGAITAYQALIVNNPRDVEAQTRLGSLLSGERRPTEAIAVLQRALVIDPNSATTWNVLSGVQNRAGMGEQAVASARRYVALLPDEPNAWDSLGLSLHIAGQLDEAASAYRKALALRPGFKLAIIHLANLAYQSGRFNESLDWCRQFLDLASSNSEKARGYRCQASTYARWNRHQEANAATEKSLALDPYDVDGPALLALQQGNRKRAIQLTEVQFARNDRGHRTQGRSRFVLLGGIAASEGRTEAALAAFQDALRENPPVYGTDWYEDCLADALAALGRYDEAILEYQRALAKFPGMALTRYHLAVVYDRQGKREQARAEFERFLKEWKNADPGAPELALAAKRLQ